MTLRLLPRSLVGRVFALYTAALVAFVGGGLSLFYRYQFTVELEDSQQRAEALAAVLLPTVSDSAVIGDYDTIRRTLERAVHDRTFASAAFIDLRGGRVQVPRDEAPPVTPPDWLRNLVAARLYDDNLPINVGGRDYGVLRLSFSAEHIAGGLWAQTRIALALALGCLAGGLLLIRFPLVRWLGDLDRVKAFDEALQRGRVDATMLATGTVASEFRDTFEALGRTAASLQAQLQARDAALVSLRQVLEDLTKDAGQPAAAPSDDLSAISAMISTLVARLQVRGEQLDAIFALSPDGFVSFDDQRHANYVSPAFETLTGLPAAQVLGQDEATLERLLHAQCAADAPWRGLQAARQDLRDAEAGTPARRHLLDLVRPSCRVLELGLREGTTPVISQVLSLRDVTHETVVDQMKSEFLSTAAHELRTPMASIYGFVELMMMRTLKPERQRETLEVIHRQTQRMIAIVNELLDLARIEARRGQDFQLEAVSLAGLLRESLTEFRPPGEREGPQVQWPQRGITVRVDRNKMHQALGNVLSNAYKYSPDGGPVRLRVVEDGGAVGVEISDAGIGMTPQQLARVSERFYRADTSGSIPGTGLGMSIVKEIIELLGGRLALASVPGQGTTVTLWLPEATPAAAGNPVLELA